MHPRPKSLPISYADVSPILIKLIVAFGAIQVIGFLVFEFRLSDNTPAGLGGRLALLRSTDSAAQFEASNQPSLPLYQVPSLFQDEYDKIDGDNDADRCKRYGYTYNAAMAKTPRRLFFGTMIADEHWDVFLAHATEAYDVYHVVALVESNTTHMATPRTMRFHEGSPAWKKLMEEKLFGKNTNIFVDYWLEDEKELLEMNRECTQRVSIVDRWVKEGMTEHDVGIMADIDEVFSRDFLRAAQVCDIPQFAPGQTCQKPKLVAATISFESSPECIKHKPWFHPDMVSGQCIEGVGDSTERIIPKRAFKRKYGARTKEYGGQSVEDFSEEIRKSGRFPLYNGADMRINPGDSGEPGHWRDKPGSYNGKQEEIWGIAYHFHNFFDSLQVLRSKYRYFAHPDHLAFKKHLGQLEYDLDVLVRCVKKLPIQAHRSPETRGVFSGGYTGTVGNKPIFFLNATYRQQRHEQITRLVMEDEVLYGSDYDKNGNYTG